MKLVNRLPFFPQLRIRHKSVKIAISVILLCLFVRFIPYLAPLRSADIAQTRLSLEFTDRNGLPLGTILTRDQEHTAVVRLKQVSPIFIQAILAAEDGDFYHHGALDLKAIARATQDAIYTKRITSGASTITMQLARMLDGSPRNLSGKIQEIWTSWRLFAGMNRDEILAAYINRLPMGGNIYGVEAAARTYFSIPAKDLNLAQASLLAAIPNNPTYFNPYQHWQRLKKRQKYVLRRMIQDKYISQEDGKLASIEKVVFQRQQGIIAAPHFLFWLAKQGESNSETSAPIVTTIDRELQQFTEAQLRQILANLKNNNVHHGAALVVDNHRGEVLAYVGSPDYFSQENIGKNDGVQALRQPGSTLKPFLYELALEKGVIKPNSLLADVPTHYAIPGAKLYSPTDYTKNFLGNVRVRIALANSLNVPAVKVLEKVGVHSFLERLKELGFQNLNQSAEHYGLGLTLGSGEVNLWELTQAYLTMANQGQKLPLTPIISSAPTPNPPPPSKTWQLIGDMLSDRHARATAFGVDSVLNLPFAAAVKTGTSSNYRDTWTVGFSKDYTVATWVGNFNGEPMKQVSGVTGAAPLWNRIMLHLHEQQEPEEFSPPQGMVQLPICAETGLKPTDKCSSVVQEYFFKEDVANYHQGQSLVRENLDSSFKLASPQNQDIFLVTPGNIGKDKLQLKLVKTPQEKVEWWLNGSKIDEGTQQAIFWSLHPGKWELIVKSGELSHRVNFTVELGNYQPKNRGFSVR
ncbi:penicillin-binding protein 1C [Calothrix sp. 336/3]|uniref:penicillin-binding protein 1C n=1 Tax=Calothrix sp. 336/3 TaxID=1337936 RepID=UPI0004E30B96|nr:penicillin-binding protein 1C [Calothrix sp. 336/3]AKG20176.1 penicillin-binding protein [Calothrix sp. 336/3]